MALALSPTTHEKFFAKQQGTADSAKPGAIFAGRNVTYTEEKVNDSHYFTMTFDKETANVHLQKEPIVGKLNKKMRTVTEGNIKRFKLQNSQSAIKALLNNLLN